MLAECLEVFKELLDVQQENLILDSYIPADGSYFIVRKDGTVSDPVEIKMDKKTRSIDRSHPDFREICFYDYYSQLISMNKPQDPGKIVHSNGCYSFWVKKDSVLNGKLTPEVIERYYETLSMPEKKYEKSKEASKIYETIKAEIGEVDQEVLEKNKEWIENHIFQLENVDMTKKDYLKIFFEADREQIIREARRYFLPNIYNSNDYNVEIEGKIYGLPDNNLGMNAKKPFLSVKTRKTPASYLLDGGEAMVQKQFFDYLMNFAAAGYYNLYVDLQGQRFLPCKNGEFPSGAVSGFFIKIQKGKEVEIHHQDVLPYYNNVLDKNERFIYKNVLGFQHDYHKEYNYEYKPYGKREDIERLLDQIFFMKMLKNNYFTEPDKLSIPDNCVEQNLLLSRDMLFNWIYKADPNGVLGVIKKISFALAKDSVANGYTEKAARQINLRWSLIEYLDKGGEEMGAILGKIKEDFREKINEKETTDFSSDKEYFFGVGQMAYYLISLNKGAKKNSSLINPFLNAKTNSALKDRLLQYYKKYDYAIAYQKGGRTNNLMAMIEGYEPDGPVDQDMILMGFTCNNLIYEKGDK